MFRALGRSCYAMKADAIVARSAMQKCRKLATELGVDVEARFDGSWHEIVAEASHGKRFAASNAHGLVIANARATSDGLWAGLLKDLEVGLEECDTVECDVCDEECSICAGTGTVEMAALPKGARA